MADTQTLLFTVENGVGWITLNRPEARNAMNADMRQAYFDALERCATEPDIRQRFLHDNAVRAFNLKV